MEPNDTPCMLCLHCRTSPQRAGGGTTYVKVRCVRGRWRTPGGDERMHHISHVADIDVPGCPDFVTMVDDGEDPAACARASGASLPATRVVCGERW